MFNNGIYMDVFFFLAFLKEIVYSIFKIIIDLKYITEL